MSEPVVTLPQGQVELPIRALRIQVVEGPDTGRAHRARAETLAIGTRGRQRPRADRRTVSRYHLELSRGRTGRRASRLRLDQRHSSAACALERGVVAPGTCCGSASTTLRVDDGGAVDARAARDRRARRACAAARR